MKYAFLVLSVFAMGVVARADSELDGKAPAVVLGQLNPVTNTISNFRVPSPTAQLSPETLGKLSPEERNARIQAFTKQVAVPANLISEEKAAKEQSELDHTGSTSAHHWRWRGYNTGYYYGYNFNLYYGGYRYYYRPAWTWANYYYNTGGYYHYYPRYNDCYYTVYNWDGYYWN